MIQVKKEILKRKSTLPYQNMNITFLNISGHIYNQTGISLHSEVVLRAATHDLHVRALIYLAPTYF